MQSRGIPGPKPRKVAAAVAVSASSKDLKLAAATGAAAAAAVDYADSMRDDFPGIPWSQMPLSILHDYRHAHKLATPSAYARPISKILFSSGIGLRSPTAIAARKATASSSSSSSSSASSASSAYHNRHRHARKTRKITSQDRVGKDQLALAVRKHFNAAGLVEQDAIARFLYKVREEGKGREFRLRFQP